MNDILSNINSGRGLLSSLSAFTLAEVLITLGIIGVVAAMTLPSLINRTQNRQLQTAFKAAYSIIAQTVTKINSDVGGNLKQIYTEYDGSYFVKADELYDLFYNNSNLKVIGECKYENNSRNYNKSADADVLGSGKTTPDKALANGMCFNVKVNGFHIIFSVDVNGTKGPNLLGHDIFFFYVDDNDMLKPFKQSRHYTDEELASGNVNDPVLAGYPCSASSSQAGNGFGCAYYALIDQNPDDSSKKYWEALP